MDCCEKEALLTVKLLGLCENRAGESHFRQVKHLIKQTVRDELAPQKWPKQSGREHE